MANYTELRAELNRNYHKVWKWRKESLCFMKENWLKKYFRIWQNREGRTEVKASEFSIRFYIPSQAMCLSTIVNQSQRIYICFLLYKGLSLSLGCLFVVLLLFSTKFYEYYRNSNSSVKKINNQNSKTVLTLS